MSDTRPLNSENPRRVKIVWDGPFSVDEACELNSKNDFGIYQIYGQHPVFGRDSLLYIGKTEDFGERFHKHKQRWLSEESDVSIRVGRLELPESDASNSSDLIHAAEKLLIYNHAPPYNTHHINRYDGIQLHVQNWGQRGSLLPESSSVWSSPRELEHEKD